MATGEDGGMTMSNHEFAHAGSLLSLHHLLDLVICPSMRKGRVARSRDCKKVVRLIYLCMEPHLQMHSKRGSDMSRTRVDVVVGSPNLPNSLAREIWNMGVG